MPECGPNVRSLKRPLGRSDFDEFLRWGGKSPAGRIGCLSYFVRQDHAPCPMQTKSVIIGSIRLPTSQLDYVLGTCSRAIHLEHRLIELLLFGLQMCERDQFCTDIFGVFRAKGAARDLIARVI